jgi:hypothetical protein
MSRAKVFVKKVEVENGALEKRLCSGEGEKLISGEEVLGIWSMCVTETEKFFTSSS